MRLRWQTVLDSAVWAAVLLLALWGPTAAADTPPSSATQVPGTTLEAQARDEGTSLAPWLIGSGVAAAAAVAVGGTALRRRMQ